jgi:glucose-1-phosphate adenylyltransferase
MPNMNDILAVILGGGQGKRLYPLTAERAKPAVPIAGKYRLIDIPISNCINSNIFHISVLTQFLSVSLHRHISRTYNFDPFHQGWVQIWAAEQTMEHTDWYQGTADAVRKQLQEIISTRKKDVLILAGDHLYRMDYSEMARFHRDNDADITVAVQPVPKDEASRFGLLKRATDGRITDFAEKPKDPAILTGMVSRDDPEKPYLGSMGIYIFKTELLVDILKRSRGTEHLDDFGGDIIPHFIKSGERVFGYNFEGYWRDIGTIRSFYETNLELTDPNPSFDFYDSEHPIFTHPRFLPGSIVENGKLNNVLLSEGCTLVNAVVEHSVIGLRSQIGSNSRVKDSIIMGADWYGTNKHGSPLGIGKNCDIQGAIIDKNTSLGDGVIIKPFPKDRDVDHPLYTVREGVVVVPKSTSIPAGTVIEP